MDLQFDSDKNEFRKRNSSAQNSVTGIIGLLQKIGLAKNATAAKRILIIVLIACVVAMFFLIFSNKTEKPIPFKRPPEHAIPARLR